MEWIVVERDCEPPMTEAQARARSQSPGVMSLYDVEPVRSYLSSDGSRMICVFRAPDAESVHAAEKGDKTQHTRVWSSTVHTP